MGPGLGAKAPVAADLLLPVEPAPEARIEAAARELDLADTNSVIFFGAKAQAQLTTLADSMLENVRAKDAGPAGDALGRMVAKLRELDVAGLDPRGKAGLLGRLLGARGGVERYLERYEDVRAQIDRIADDLERHKTRLLTDIVRLDKLYDANLDYFRTLEVYIGAGRRKLDELDRTLIPQLAERTEASSDLVSTQRLRDLRTVRDDLERRIHDLLLTRQVTMQALPSIRLVQENDKSLVTKISSTLANTVPLWRQQLAQAVTIYRMGAAAKATQAASDLTNELLRSNAENLQDANATVRREIERGVFDIETVRHANERLVATIEESLSIADAGRRSRAEAERQLLDCESSLRRALAAATARSPSGDQAGGRSAGSQT